MRILLRLSAVVFLFFFTGIGVRAADSPPAKSGSAKEEFQKIQAEFNDLNSELRNLQVEYRKAEKADRPAVEKKWKEAKELLERLVQLYPEDAGSGNPYLLLAQVHRSLGEAQEERVVLGKLARIAPDAIDAYSRLMELETARSDWDGVKRHAERFLAVNPLVPQPYRYLA